MKKLLLIMNPYSGQRKANRYLVDILTMFNRAGFETQVHITAGPGDGAKIVAEKAKEVDLIVCVGGDGTFNEAISGILTAGCDTPLGYIPAGSTNDFANSLKLPTDPLEAAAAIIDGDPVAYDVGKFGDRYFSYIASFGAFTRVSYTTPQNIKNALGHTAYVLEGIQELSQIRNEHIRIELEDRVIEDDFIFGAICNSTSVGGILTLDPNQVDMSDGLLELLLIRTPRSLAELAECITALQTQKYNCEMITFTSAHTLKVFPNPEMLWTLDGEREEGHESVDVVNLHHAFRLMRRG